MLTYSKLVQTCTYSKLQLQFDVLYNQTIFFCALLSLQLLRYMHNKTIIGFGFRMIARIIKASVCVIRLSLRLQQITQTLALIILAIMLNLIQQLLNKTWPVLLDAKPCQQIIGYSLLNEHGDLPFSIIGEPACSGNQTKPHNL